MFLHVAGIHVIHLSCGHIFADVYDGVEAIAIAYRRVFFIVFGDFKCLMVPVNGVATLTRNLNPPIAR